MERINQYAFYELGFRLHVFHEATEEIETDFDNYFKLVTARSRIHDLLTGKPISVGVSRVKAASAESAIGAMIKKYFETPNEPGEDSKLIPVWEWNSLKKTVEAFETVFAEEMREAATYRVPQRGIYDVVKLVDSADDTFPNHLRISAKARAEWQAAGRCLAFGLFSASGYHVARAVEAVLEDYCAALSIQVKERPVWGDYITALGEAEGTVKPDPKTISEIKQMKDDWRNPLMHPRVVLDYAQARMLFANGESLIIAMASEVGNIEPQSAGLGAAVQALIEGAGAQVT